MFHGFGVQGYLDTQRPYPSIVIVMEVDNDPIVKETR